MTGRCRGQRRPNGPNYPAIVATLAIGVGVAAAFTPGSTTAFQHDRHFPYHHRFVAPPGP